MESNFLIYQNFRYIKNNKNKDTTYYRCAKLNGRLCSARIIKKNNNITLKGSHNCININNNCKEINSDILEKIIVEHASDLSKTPGQVYQNIVSNVSNLTENDAMVIPCKQTIRTKIKRVRGTEIIKIGDMMETDLGKTLDGYQFLKIYKKFYVQDKIEQFAIWGSEEGLSILRQNNQIYIDGTFKISPNPFKQCLIIMAFDNSTNLFVPCIFSLLSAKNENMYWMFLQEAIALMDWKWEPSVIITDFELALIKACKAQFNKSKLYGCFFHFKQAIKKNLKKFLISKDNIKLITKSIDFLTIINKSDINKAISYLEFKYNNLKPEFKNFLIYFEKIWIKKFPPTLWNINEKKRNKLIGITNNSLERYNRRLNEQILNSNPNILSFVNLIKNEENFYSNQLRGIRSGLIKRENKNYKKKNIKIPKNFINYINN